MSRPPLSKLLAQRKLRNSLEQFLRGMNLPIAITDLDGAVLLGESGDGEEHAICLSGETIGWVHGPAMAAPVAEFLSFLVTGESEKRELAREGVQKYKELALLYDVSERIGSCLSIEDTSRLVLEEVRRTIPKGTPHLALLDPGHVRFTEPIESGTANIPPQLHEFLLPLVDEGRSEIVNNIADDLRLAKASIPAGSLMAAPLRTKDRTLGVLVILCDSPVEFRSEELRLLSALATLCASSIEKTRLYENVERETRLRSHFQRYLSPTVVDDILANRAEIALGGKSVECSILFSDLCGFTSLTEQRDPEQIIELLNEYFTVMSHIILSRGGTLDKFIGDAIMAVFGAPCELPHAPAAAIGVALEMHQALWRLNWKWAVEGWPMVRHRIGINTGRVISGNIGSEQRMDYTVVGDPVNLAARLEALSPPMETTCSHETYQEVASLAVTRPLPPVHVKGKAQPVWPHQVIGVRAGTVPDGMWGTAMPLQWRGAGVMVEPAPGLLVGLGREQILIETPVQLPLGRELLVQFAPPRGEQASSAPLRAGVSRSDAREDAAGNRFHQSSLEFEERELPPALSRIRQLFVKSQS